MNKFLTKLKNGKTAIGTHAQLGSPVMMEIMGMAGFDAVWIDTEHTAIDKQDLLHSVIALNGYGAGQAGAAMRQWLDRGANFVFVGSDIAYAASGAAQTFADMAGIFG